MSSSLLEIIRLDSGEIVLRRTDEENKPLVSLTFSSEVQDFLGDYSEDVGNAMINAGIQLASKLYEQSVDQDEDNRILH